MGGVGTIHWLHFVSSDRARRVRVMAYVVRTVQLADVGGQRTGGVAFEFMPESDDAHAALQDFVRYVLARRFDEARDAHIAPRIDVGVSDGGGRRGDVRDIARDSPPEHAATLQKLSVRTMVLETSWAIKPGEKVRVDIVAPGMTRRIRLDGRAVRVNAKDSARFDIELEVQSETERPLRSHSSMTLQAVQLPSRAPAPSPSPSPAAADDDITGVLDDLLSALILPPIDHGAARHRRDFLSGKLAQVRLPTILSLIEMERMSGKLVLTRDLDEAKVFVSNGEVLDVEPLEEGQSPRAKLGELMAWDSGSFELHAETVTRPNRVNARTTALILDLARESDERGRS